MEKIFDHVIQNDSVFDGEEVKVARNILHSPPIWSKFATIYGIVFGSRGSQYRETQPPTFQKQGESFLLSPSTESRRWNEKAEYSSWCKFQVRSRTGAIKRYYGKINSFFSANFIGDDTIKNCILVSVTTFHCKEGNRSAFKNSDVVEETGSLEKEYFVAAQDICPTRIAVIPFFNEEKAILLNQNPAKKYNKEYSRYYVNREHDPTFYVMLSLSPEKELYQTTEIDDRSFDKYM